uniref:ARAD1B01694p n=1 Tax=Blastobotrys adeninivorans TaxID=409370 RepID=A0A060TAM9_BLAAD
MVQLSTFVVIAMAARCMAHPGGHGPSLPQSVRRSYLANAKRTLDQCADHLERRGINAHMAARREEAYETYRRQALNARSDSDDLGTPHHSSLHVTEDTPASELFSNNPVCILAPEQIIGPYWVKGELIRSDIREDQPGIPIIVDTQFINIETCEPIENLYSDVWHCNSTGVYSGVQNETNGNGDDDSILDKNFLRGLQKTDLDGVAQFKSIFPGHYEGRATHIHIVAHIGAKVLENNTLAGGNIAHIGQLYFDQDLIDAVEATRPYSDNTVPATLNKDDNILQGALEDSDSDPFFEYALLGDSLQEGLFAWVTLGVNVSASYDAQWAAILTDSDGDDEASE